VTAADSVIVDVSADVFYEIEDPLKSLRIKDIDEYIEQQVDVTLVSIIGQYASTVVGIGGPQKSLSVDDEDEVFNSMHESGSDIKGKTRQESIAHFITEDSALHVRQEIQDKFNEQFTEIMAENGIKVSKVALRDYKNGDRTVQHEIAEQTVRTVKIRNENKTARMVAANKRIKAEGDKSVKVTTATAEAEAAEIKARGQANAQRIRAEGEAEAIKIRAAALLLAMDELGKNPEAVKLKFLEQQSDMIGQLPKTTTLFAGAGMFGDALKPNTFVVNDPAVHDGPRVVSTIVPGVGGN